MSWDERYGVWSVIYMGGIAIAFRSLVKERKDAVIIYLYVTKLISETGYHFFFECGIQLLMQQ